MLDDGSQYVYGAGLVSQITANGNASATSTAKSQVPRPPMSSTIARARRWTFCASIATRRGENTAFTIVRIAVCSGTSMLSIPL